MIKKLLKYGKIVIAMTLIGALTLPSYATVGASDGSAFVTKAEFDAALSDFNARLTTFEAGINSKIDSQVSSYLDRNGIWNGKEIDWTETGKLWEFYLEKNMCTPHTNWTQFKFNSGTHGYSTIDQAVPGIPVWEPKWNTKYSNIIGTATKSGMLVGNLYGRVGGSYSGCVDWSDSYGLSTFGTHSWLYSWRGLTAAQKTIEKCRELRSDYGWYDNLLWAWNSSGDTSSWASESDGLALSYDLEIGNGDNWTVALTERMMRCNYFHYTKSQYYPDPLSGYDNSLHGGIISCFVSKGQQLRVSWYFQKIGTMYGGLAYQFAYRYVANYMEYLEANGHKGQNYKCVTLCDDFMVY